MTCRCSDLRGTPLGDIPYVGCCSALVPPEDPVKRNLMVLPAQSTVMMPPGLERPAAAVTASIRSCCVRWQLWRACCTRGCRCHRPAPPRSPAPAGFPPQLSGPALVLMGEAAPGDRCPLVLVGEVLEVPARVTCRSCCPEACRDYRGQQFHARADRAASGPVVVLCAAANRAMWAACEAVCGGTGIT